MGRTSDARERLLNAACELMLRRGYGSLGVAEICAHADVRKGSFYYFFPSKQALTLAAIDDHWQRQRTEWTGLLTGPEPALARLERLVRHQTTVQRDAKQAAGAVSGCLFGNLALELSGQERDVQQRLEEIFDEQIDLVETVLHEAVAEESIPPAGANRAIARAIVAQLEGMVLFAKLANDPGLLGDLWQHTLLLLGAPELITEGTGRTG